MTEHYFSADAALIDRLGRELVGKQETALVELVKNAYDADAIEVRVSLEQDKLTIEDNGSGMSQRELVDGFLRLASDMKVRNPHSPRFKRQRAGRKGIGRFATHRLGANLVLQTWNGTDPKALELSVNWRKFEQGKSLDQIPVTVREIPAEKRGTTIVISHLRDTWSDEQVRRCWRGVMNLQQPFPVAPVSGRPTEDPGFEVQFYRKRDLISDPKVVADFQSEILDHMHAVIEMHVDEKGVAEWRLIHNRFGENRPWTRFHHQHRNSSDPPPYEHLRGVWMTAYYVILAPDLLSGFVYSRVRDVMREEGGIRLYRNGFRVVPYGEPDDDWLSLDYRYSQRGSVLAPIANRNFFGVVEVHDDRGIDFEEHTSREGLIEKPAVAELRAAAAAALSTAVLKIAEDRGRKTSAGTPPRTRDPQTALEKIRAAAKAAAEAAGAGNQEGPGGTAAGDTAALLQQTGDALERAVKELADEKAMLRLLSTLGLTAAEFSHETGMTFAAVRLDFKGIFKAALDAKANDKPFIEKLERARAMFDRLDALTSYMNELASARSVRELTPISVSAAAEDFDHGMRSLAERAEITLKIKTPALDPLFTRPMHKAEVASVLLNFYSNSVKAMKESQEKRKILIEASRDGDETIVLRFADSGKGVPDNNKERVFELFFTTTGSAPSDASATEEVTGTGLGLWIVRQIAQNAGGEVQLIDPPPGYATCFELRLPAEDTVGD